MPEATHQPGQGWGARPPCGPGPGSSLYAVEMMESNSRPRGTVRNVCVPAASGAFGSWSEPCFVLLRKVSWQLFLHRKSPREQSPRKAAACSRAEVGTGSNLLPMAASPAPWMGAHPPGFLFLSRPELPLYCPVSTPMVAPHVLSPFLPTWPRSFNCMFSTCPHPNM